MSRRPHASANLFALLFGFVIVALHAIQLLAAIPDASGYGLALATTKIGLLARRPARSPSWPPAAATSPTESQRCSTRTAAYTGLRRSELRGLRWRALDFHGSLLHVERGYTNEGGEDLPKSYRVRSVPMTPRVAAALSRLREREHFTQDDDLVFVNSVGRPVGDDKLHKRFKAAIRAAELPELRFHDLRHSFGTMAVRAFPITDVQTWMGHADISTTRRYVHYAPQADAARRLGELIDAAREQPAMPLRLVS